MTQPWGTPTEKGRGGDRIVDDTEKVLTWVEGEPRKSGVLDKGVKFLEGKLVVNCIKGNKKV